MAHLSRDPSVGAITYEITGPVSGKYTVERLCDNGGNASSYKFTTADQEFASLIANQMAASEGGTVI